MSHELTPRRGDSHEVDDAIAGPEHSAKHTLTEWLESHGARVWWEEMNPWDHPLFTIDRGGRTSQSRPDLVVEISGYCFVIEFKPGSSSGGVYDALLQLHGYWLNHIIHDQEYVVDGEPVAIDGFLTATRNSRYGRLFPAYAEGDLQMLSDMDEGRASCVEYGQLPPAEFPMTEQHVRPIWRLGKRSRERFNFAPDRHISNLGALLSDHLEREQFDPSPAVLWDRGQRNQSWEVLADA